MTLRTGIDICEIARLRQAIERQGERLLARVFTPTERQQCGNNYASLAARFAAKEAVGKALGTGLGPVAFTEIEILRGENHEPLLRLHGKALQRAHALNLDEWAISLSHTQEYALASVVGLGREKTTKKRKRKDE
ncbi:MAG: holo-[acyl-carrier-protein] synthase [Anaerolineae bacterium]|nr:MAG: holo-[acyl-carrier-protein] synthase [Anaerolineae bacterium]